jgi:hypothetical protein
MTRRSLFGFFLTALGTWATWRWKKIAEPNLKPEMHEFWNLNKNELVTTGWSDMLLTEGETFIISEDLLREIGFLQAVGPGQFRDGVLQFTVELPNPLRAGTPGQHKTA